MPQDIAWALRWLRKNPLFTAAITAILALGIGANTAVFSIVDAVLLRPLPYRSVERLVRIEESGGKHPPNGVPVPDFFRLRDRTDLFESAFPYFRDTVTVTGGGDPDQVIAFRVGGGVFPSLGVRAQLGRGLLESDDHIVVLTDRL